MENVVALNDVTLQNQFGLWRQVVRLTVAGLGTDFGGTVLAPGAKWLRYWPPY